MTKFKAQNKFKFQNSKTKILIFVICALSLFCHLCFVICHLSFAQDTDLEFTLDVTSNTIPTPSIFKPNIDLSGRGIYQREDLPQGMAAPEVLDAWQKDIGFSGLYRLQYNLWEIYELAKDKAAQDKLLAHYEEIIKKVSDAGGIVILDIFGTPAGLGRVLDRKSPVIDSRAYKQLVKDLMRALSCDKRYNLWYEAWSAPDLDDFFLGRKQDYFNLYRAIAESAKELELETKIHIPVGGPSVSWWFQNLDGNTIITPERSLIYELIKFCYHYRLPLDFVSWHAYSSDPKAEKEVTRYNKTATALIRDWLSYFRFDRNTPLIVDEWNFDAGTNLSRARSQDGHILASYILSRIKNMYEAGLNYQLFFSLEDFHNEKEGVVRDVGVFWFDHESTKYKGGPKSAYTVFRMLPALGKKMFFSLKLDDEFVGAVASKGEDEFTIIVYNYIDPQIALNYLGKNVVRLSEAERRFLLGLVKNKTLEKIISQKLEISSLRSTNRLKTFLKKAQELNIVAEKFKVTPRNIKIGLKNLKSNYLLQRFTVDASCNPNCELKAVEEKEVFGSDLYQESFSLSPYSVNMLVFKKRPLETRAMSDKPSEDSATEVKVSGVEDKNNLMPK